LHYSPDFFIGNSFQFWFMNTQRINICEKFLIYWLSLIDSKAVPLHHAGTKGGESNIAPTHSWLWH
jgi:hypothetical protein